LGHRNGYHLADDLRADLARHGGVVMTKTQEETETWLVKAERDALASLLLSVQRDCITATARIRELEAALRIIAGYEQCADNLMSNVEVARAALNTQAGGKDESVDLHQIGNGSTSRPHP
jgi:hypothetical protein